VALHPLAAQFDAVAAAYDRGRPEYPLAAVGAIAAELGVAPGAPVLDLAAGTGKLTRALLAAGYEAVAVEPQAGMRAVLAERVGAEHVREGVAEAIPLAERSVALVTVADGFHWFEKPAALREIRRVLRPGGGLALVTTIPDWGGASWAQELGTLTAGLRPEHPHYDGPPWQEAVREAGGWSEPRELRVTTWWPAHPELLVDYLASISWIQALDDRDRERTLARAREIIDAGQTPAELPMHYAIGLVSLAG
jgi:SAM-dependent methyltransferase